MTGIPLLDIILNIDLFTSRLDDKKKVLRILKTLFNNCTPFKKLLLRHHHLIISVLLSKYDKQCHRVKHNENQDEFQCTYIGQLLRLYSKSKTLSRCFQNFYILTYLVKLMQKEQYDISSDAHKTFESVLKGSRIEYSLDREDKFIQWIESNEDGNGTHHYELLNQIFYDMRQSQNYAFKRISMKILYEILSIGLSQCLIDI